MNVLARVVFHVDAGDADALLPFFRVDEDMAVFGHGQVELGYLVAHGQVRVEIVLAGEKRGTVHRAIHGQSHFYRVFHGPGVHHRQGARHARAHGAGILVGGGPEGRGTGTENLAAGFELGMHFQPDDDFVIHDCLAF